MPTGTSSRRTFTFKVTLRDTKPPIWRRIEVPADYTFWDLHVAIQDAMGWFDMHLHGFRVVDRETGADTEIGIPDPEGFDSYPVLPSWKVKLTRYLDVGDHVDYTYDFGDDWIHKVGLESTGIRHDDTTYPRCLGGRRACPPEDCGGPWQYARILAALADPTGPDAEERIAMVRPDFDPAAFDPDHVHFDDPAERLKAAFEE